MTSVTAEMITSTSSASEAKPARLRPFERYDAPELSAPNPGFDRSIGGSSLAAILGVSPWESPYERWLRLTGRVGGVPDNPAMARGRTWEPIVAEMFAASHPEFEVTHENPVTGQTWFVRDSEHPYLTGQPDRMLHDPNGYLRAGLEIKTSSWRNIQTWGEEGTDQVPQGYLLQSNWYAGLMRVEAWHLIVEFFNENSRGVETPYMTREYLIPFDAELFELCRQRAVAFWEDFVLTDTPPEQTGVGETFVRYVRERFPRNVEPIAEATADEEAVMEAVMTAKKRADEAAAEFELQKARMQALIGDRAGLISDTLGRITWKSSKDRETVDWRGIVAEIGCSEEIKAKHTITRPGSRTFLISGKTSKQQEAEK